MKYSQKALLTEKPLKLIVKYSLPALIAMIINGVQGMIDGIFVGNFIDSNALASVNIASPFTQIIIGISMIISIGTQSHVSIQLGMGEDKKAKDTYQTFFRIITIVAIVISILGVLFSKQIAMGLGADEVLLEASATYIKTIAFFVLPICLMFYFGFLNRVSGRPELYLFGAILSVFVNVGLNYLFLAHLNLGIQGAALATGIAYTSALLVVISPALKKSTLLNVYTGKFSSKTVLPVLYNGSSEGISSLSTAVTLFLFNTALMNVAGPDGVAAFTAINYIGTFGALLLFGISDGIGPIVSYNYGAGRRDRVKKIMKISYLGNLMFGTIVFCILFFFGEFLVGIFIKGKPEVVQFAAIGAKIYAFAFLLSGFNVLTSGCFTFIGKGLQSVVVASCRGLIFVTIGILVLPKIFDVSGIWMSVPFAELMAFIVSIALLNYEKAKKRNITKLN